MIDMMDNIVKTIRYNDLLNIYETLLSDTQCDILTAYFAYDLSLGEIAENRHVSRAAVEDALKKGVAKLEAYEKELHLLEKREKILKITANLKQKTQNKEDTALLEEIERTIK